MSGDDQQSEPDPRNEGLERFRLDLERFLAVLDGRLDAALVSVVVFGSRARGSAGRDSDLDLLIVAADLPNSRLDRQRLVLGLARSVSAELADALMPVVLRPEEARDVKPFYLGMLSGHVVLRDRGDFFADVLRRLRARLAELGARRHVDQDGYEYWDLKPDWKPGDVVTL